MTTRALRCWIALLLLSAGMASQATMAACGGSLLSGMAVGGAPDGRTAHGPTHVSHADADVSSSHTDAGAMQASHTDDPTHAPQRCGATMSCGVASPALPAAVLTSWPPTDATADSSIPAAGASFLQTAEPPPPRLLLI